MKKIPCLLVLLLAFCPIARAADPDELVFIFQKQKDPAQVKSTAERVGEYLSAAVGKPVKVVVPADYSASVQALVSKKADFAYVSAMPFLLARRDGNASLLLAERRADADGQMRTDYNSIFVVRADSPLKTLDDLISSAKAQRVCFTSPTSTSGYIMAISRLTSAGLLKSRQDPREAFAEVSFGGGYTQALEQVIAGRADVCAVSDYTMEGPKADVYLKPEQREQLRVLARTPGVPTHLIAARDGLSDDLKGKVKQALLKLAEEQPDLLADVYGATAFTEVDEDAHVAKAIEALEHTGVDVAKLAK
jgi:phosphonate transport system substrate-binding protein